MRKHSPHYQRRIPFLLNDIEGRTEALSLKIEPVLKIWIEQKGGDKFHYLLLLEEYIKDYEGRHSKLVEAITALADLQFDFGHKTARTVASAGDEEEIQKQWQLIMTLIGCEDT